MLSFESDSFDDEFLADLVPITDRIIRQDRKSVSYWDSLGNETVVHYSSEVADENIPQQITCPTSGLPAGLDRKNPPVDVSNEPYKTHLAYVKERRTTEEAAELLENALAKYRERFGKA